MENANNLALNSSWNTTSNYQGQSNTNWYDPNTYTPFVNTVYIPYQQFWYNEDKITKSFKLVQKLIEKKTIKEPKTVKDFIELVNSISEIL